jgi:Ca2+-binding RTX toxin-like protein
MAPLTLPEPDFDGSYSNILFSAEGGSLVNWAGGLAYPTVYAVKVGGAAGDTLIGTDGDDQLRGMGGADSLVGGPGNDRLMGNDTDPRDGGATDTLIGGLGDDEYHIGPEDIVIEEAGGGTDTIFVFHNVSLAGTQIENLYLRGAVFSTAYEGTGNELKNEMTGNGANNTLLGAGGDDVLNGEQRNDTLMGGSGHDTLNGGGHDDTLTGGGGADTFRILIEGNHGLTQGIDRITDFDAVTERFDLRGGAFLSMVESGGNTTLTHASGSVIVEGITGLSRAEWNALSEGNAIRAFHDADYRGHSFHEIDRLRFIDAHDSKISVSFDAGQFVPGEIASTLRVHGGATYDDIQVFLPAAGGAFSVAAWVFYGWSSVDRVSLNGDAGNDTITGSTVADQIYGNGANDALDGGIGDDKLYGGDGADTLTGGGGDDRMDGGDGADVFRFLAAPGGTDRIDAFSAAEDRFDLALGEAFTAVSENNGNTRLTHDGGIILVTGITGLTLAGWNALILPDGSSTLPALAPAVDYLFA